MNASNKNRSLTRGRSQSISPQATAARQFKPVGIQQATPKAVQLKVANGALNRKPSVAPPVYHPQPAPKVLQKKAPSLNPVQVPRRPVASQKQTSLGAPPIGRAVSAVQRKTHSTANPLPALLSSVIQRAKKGADYSGANVKVVCSYSSDTGKNVRNAFLKAGYTMANWQKAAAGALRKTKWKREKIAHGKGVEGASGKRGGTDEEVQECAEFLINWAGAHPPTPSCKPSQPKFHRKPDDDDERKPGGGGGKPSSNLLGSGEPYVPPWLGGPAAWISQKT